LVLLECLTGPSAGLDAVAADGWRSILAAMLDPDPDRRPDAREAVEAFRRLIVEETGRHRGGPGDSAEPERLEAVRGYGVLDTPPDAPFDRIAQLAARVLGTS